MRWMSVPALLVCSTNAFAGVQAPAPVLPVPPAAVQSERVKVYALDPDVKAPELLPLEGVPSPPGKCKSHLDGVVELALLVDENGHPQNVTFLRVLGNDLDGLAERIAAADRFKPGIHNGVPVPISASLKVGMKGCTVESTDHSARKTFSLWLRTPPDQKLAAPEVATYLPRGTSVGNASNAPARLDRVGHGVSAPMPLNSVAAQYTDEARRAKINGIVLVSLIVDAHGMPQNLRVVKSLNPDLDQNALEAVNKYRFRPAIRDGTPVPVTITVEINFRIY